MKESVEEKISNILNKIKPFLNNDGGDVEFIKFENGKCYVKLLGACTECDNTYAAKNEKKHTVKLFLFFIVSS